MTLLALKDICKSYRDGMRTRQVLDYVSLRDRPG